jgi:hypothetical protein
MKENFFVQIGGSETKRTTTTTKKTQKKNEEEKKCMLFSLLISHYDIVDITTNLAAL